MLPYLIWDIFTLHWVFPINEVGSLLFMVSMIYILSRTILRPCVKPHFNGNEYTEFVWLITRTCGCEIQKYT
ncbi:hypothetical protein H8356DRAFT_1433693 [Neocallimastix lanati (nom. inval.)]|nr:hypothetical protein H8356DRAFT_1433693 [Neocallimastix sp. JGI-2020a]